MQNKCPSAGILFAAILFLTVFALIPPGARAASYPARGKAVAARAPQAQTVPPPRELPDAEEEPSYIPPYIALGIKAGTLGAGAEITLGVLEDVLNVRAGGNYLHLRFSGKIKDVDYGVDLNMASVPLLLDCHPFCNNFRITGGFILNHNRPGLDAKLNETQKIGGHDYTPEEIGTLSGSVNFKKFAPYAGIGFGNAVGPHTSWNFVFDLGVMFQGSPDISLTADGSKSGDPVFQADLAQEEGNVQDEADKFRFYPVLAVGISYQF
ncbi:MAG: hypothetical protein PHP98_01375 [Kiritimatiellae bacterium]|jgi:hypothetical protein|nr:hypothetical protein [Kiritimatiellia bacterium]